MNELVDAAYALECKAYLDAIAVLNEDPKLAIDSAEYYTDFVRSRAEGDGYRAFKTLVTRAESLGYENGL
jgi:hypothetical protein